jgi:hypothetical protein
MFLFFLGFDLDPYPDPDPDWAKMLDPDPYPDPDSSQSGSTTLLSTLNIWNNDHIWVVGSHLEI